MRLSPAAVLLPLVTLGLYLKFIGFNALISPAGVPLPQAQQAIFACCVLATLPILFAPERFRLWLLLAIDVVLSSLALVDTLYLRYFGEIAPASALLHGTQSVHVAGSVWALLRPGDAAIVWELPVMLLLALFAHRLPLPRVWSPPRPAVWLATLGGIGGAVWTLTGVVGDFDSKHPNALSGAWNPTYIAASMGGLPYHGIDAYHALAARANAEGPATDIDAISTWLAGKNRPEAANPNWGVASGKNLIIVQVEALQGFTVGLHVAGRPVTPHLNALAKSGIHFPNVYGQTKHGNTSDSEFIANTSLYPAPRGAAFVRFSGNAFDALPTALKERGYATVAMHANNPGFWNRQSMYQSLGFSRFLSAKDYAVDEVVGLGLSDRRFFEQSLTRLAELPQPFYAWMVTLSSHHPYDEAAALSSLDVGELEGTRLGHYLKSIHYADEQLGHFFEGLKRQGLWEKSLVVVLGDHPGVQQEDAEALYALTGTRADSPIAWQSLQKVALLMHVPASKQHGRIEVAGGHVDVLPTVSNLLGLPAPHAFGRDLLQARQDFVVFNDGGYLMGNTLVDHQGQAHDLATGAPHTQAPETPAGELARRHLRYSAEILTFDLADRLRALAPAVGRSAPRAM